MATSLPLPHHDGTNPTTAWCSIDTARTESRIDQGPQETTIGSTWS